MLSGFQRMDGRKKAQKAQEEKRFYTKIAKDAKGTANVSRRSSPQENEAG